LFRIKKASQESCENAKKVDARRLTFIRWGRSRLPFKKEFCNTFPEESLFLKKRKEG